MLHLVKDIYLELDSYTDYGKNRIIISKNGITNIPGDENQIYYTDKIQTLIRDYENLSYFFETISGIEKNIWIYADTEAYLELLSIWLMNLLPNATTKDIYIFIKSQLIREKYFNTRPKNFTYFPINIDKFYKKDVEKYISNSVNNYLSDLSYSNKSSLPLEFLLCSYLYDKSYKDELKNSIKHLMIKDIQKYLSEIKEILISHPMKKSFQKRLNLKNTYDLYNIEQYFSNNNEILQIWFTDRIWYTKYENPHIPNPRVKLTNITKEDIKIFKKTTLQCGLEWSEIGIYSIRKADIHKMDFIPILQKEIMSDEDLDNIINFEINMEHSAGSFYNLENSKTNIYFIEHILQSYKDNNLNNLKPYVLR